MQCVIETIGYLKSAEIAKMSVEERIAAVDFLANNPQAGTIIVGSGGCRKVRLAGKGKGKSGGYRLITFYYDEDFPVVLWLAYAKNQEQNLSKGEVEYLYDVTKKIKEEIIDGRRTLQTAKAKR
ncbi:MAG: type II toxin-antitoxin system RelE/ParE family toxin [Pseudomonadota bacterium]